MLQTNTAISVNGLEKSYKNLKVLNKVGFSVQKGQIFALLGSNGAGKTFRSIDTVITVIAMPIMIMLMFVYVFGGAINTGSASYINYMLPGIFLMGISNGVAYTAARLNNDVTKGIFERFHSMPIARSSMLWGHVLTSVVSCVISMVVVLSIALLMGSRASAGISGWLLAQFTFIEVYLSFLVLFYFCNISVILFLADTGVLFELMPLILLRRHTWG